MGRIQFPDEDAYLVGRQTALIVGEHAIFGHRLDDRAWDSHPQLVFGMGCFWGAERAFWSLDEVVSTAVGYAGGRTPNPNYREVCSGLTGHTEVVRVVLKDRSEKGLQRVLGVFWESHDPTQGMRQGNDIGTQYRSAIYASEESMVQAAQQSLERYQQALSAAGHGRITTEVKLEPQFYFAEPEHQQYLAKNPNGYCGLGGTGVQCPLGTGVTSGV